MYSYTVDMESEEEARETVKQIASTRYQGPICISAHGKTVSVDVESPLVDGIMKLIAMASRAITFCIKEGRCYRKIVRHV